MSFDELGLRAELLEAVKSKGYQTPTPIQAQAIPEILNGRDILARAQTGTGKTDAFALPLVEILGYQKAKGLHPRALVLTPTRELALQVGESIQSYARRLSMKCTVVFGGVRIAPQIGRLKHCPTELSSGNRHHERTLSTQTKQESSLALFFYGHSPELRC